MKHVLARATIFLSLISLSVQAICAAEQDRFLVKTTQNPKQNDSKNALKEKTGTEIGNALRKLNDLQHVIGELGLIVASKPVKVSASEAERIKRLNQLIAHMVDELREEQSKLNSSPVMNMPRRSPAQVQTAKATESSSPEAVHLQALADFNRALGSLQLEVANLTHQLFSKVEELIENRGAFKKATKNNLETAFHRVKSTNMKIASIVHRLQKEGGATLIPLQVISDDKPVAEPSAEAKLELLPKELPTVRYA